MPLNDNSSQLIENNDVDDVVVDKNNINQIPDTEMSIPFDLNQKFNELLDFMYPNYDDKSNNRQRTIEQIFLLGINTMKKSIQQHQQHHCFFKNKWKKP